MKPASWRSKVVFRIALWPITIAALLSMLAGVNMAQSEPSKPSAISKETSSVRINLPGWSEKEPEHGMRFWHDSDGDVLAVRVFPKEQDYPYTSSETEQRKWCRGQAEDHKAGLIEVRASTSKVDPSASFIYKMLQKPAYTYLGQLFVRAHGAEVVWTVVAKEHGTTGIREAVVTSHLMNSGKLTLDGYKLSWSQDPYEPDYHGVDRSVLRFMSDDQSYDAQFPDHPLSKVRRVLAALPDAAHYDFDER